MGKRGITLLMLSMTVAILMFIITTTVVAGLGSIKQANYEEYKSNISRVEDNINIYYLENDKLPITNEVVSANSLGDDFYNFIVLKKDENNKLFVVNIPLLENNMIEDGLGTLADKDIFLIAENSHNVYYLKGLKFRGQIIYGN